MFMNKLPYTVYVKDCEGKIVGFEPDKPFSRVVERVVSERDEDGFTVHSVYRETVDLPAYTDGINLIVDYAVYNEAVDNRGDLVYISNLGFTREMG